MQDDDHEVKWGNVVVVNKNFARRLNSLKLVGILADIGLKEVAKDHSQIIEVAARAGNVGREEGQQTPVSAPPATYLPRDFYSDCAPA